MTSTSEDSQYLPRMVDTPYGVAPKAPASVQATGIDVAALTGLALKMAYGVPHFTLEWMSKRLLLQQGVTAALLESLHTDMFLEVLGQDAQLGYRYAISQRGRDYAERLRDICGYTGPAPVSLEAYGAMLAWQMEHHSQVTPDMVGDALSELVLPQDTVEIAGLAISSGRSLFLSGPPGNGKTSVGRALHRVFHNHLWIPHCIAVENTIIRLFDPHCHRVVEEDGEVDGNVVDRRWIKIESPLIVAGGEMTLESLDLAYHDGLRYYEAPLHMKANGGTFLIDDFGRQRLTPEALLNRWIIPLEHRIDFLTLHSGQKIEVPFRLMLIIATNLNPQDVTDPAFLRRIGYRLAITPPTPEQFATIFHHYAARCGMRCEALVVERLLARYSATGRELRSCEPRDLIERVKDICVHRGEPLQLNDALLNLAWKGYFGEG
jgi:hypothetical protein